MRFLISGDWHPDVQTIGCSRHDEVAEAVERTVEVAKNKEIDCYVFLGDLCDPDQNGHTMRAIALAVRTATALEESGIQNVWISGNHCVSNDGTGATALTPLAALAEKARWIHVAEQPRVIPLLSSEGAIGLLALPYPALVSVDERDISERATLLIRQSPIKKYVVAAHLMIPSAQRGEETTEMPRGREVSFPLVATESAAARMNGHYHRRQVTPEGIIIPGSLARLTFSEEDHEPGFVIVDV